MRTVKRRPVPLEAKFDAEILDDITREWIAECGVRIARRRELLGLHRRELADLAGTSEPTIIRVEAGTLNPKDHLRIAIAGALRCEVADIWAYPGHNSVESRARVVA